MNSDPNSDYKQCIESKPGWVHSAHTQNPGRKHTARAVPRSWALLRAQQVGRARMRAWSRAGMRRSRACWACAGRAHAGRALVATRLSSLSQVATSKRGRDFVSPTKPQARSRLPFRVATSWTTKPGRDANPMS